MGLGYFFFLGRKYAKLPDPPALRKVQKKRLSSAQTEQLEHFLAPFPDACYWGGSDWENARVRFKTKSGYSVKTGRVVLGKDSEILEWISHDGKTTIKRANNSIPEDMLLSQLAGILTDNEKAAKYCDQVADTLLEEGNCIFSVPYGLHIKETEYRDRYGSETWEKAWEKALAKEFQTRTVEKAPGAGVGCFRLIAI